MNKILRYSLLSLLLFFAGTTRAQEAIVATCAEIINGEDGTLYRVTGTCSRIANTHYGNWYIKDETGEVYIYGTQDEAGQWNFETLGLGVGDIVTIEGPKTTYGNFVELVNVRVLDIVKSPITIISLTPENGKVSAEGGTVTVTLSNSGTDMQVMIPAEAKNWLTQESVVQTESTVVVTFNIAENQGTIRDAEVKFQAMADGKVFSVFTTISQEAAADVAGSMTNPFTVAQAIAKCIEIGSVSDGNIYYAKGIISSIKEVSLDYGNATFNISDNGKEENVLTCYRSYSVNNQKFTAEDEISVGDVVVVCGKLVNYKDNTPEFSGNVYVYSLNSAGFAGTLEHPFSPAKANAFIRSLATTPTETDYFVKGKIVDIEGINQFGTQYGNATFYISGDGSDSDDKFYVYRTLYLGNVKYADDNWPKPQAGDEVIICGKLTMYRDTPETLQNQSYIYSINGQTSNIADVQSFNNESTVYSLSGQRVEKAQKGIYIMNGRKVVIK